MKYTLHINQKQAIELGITNVNQAHVFDLLTGMSTWAEPEIIDGDVFYWVSRSRISEELSLLNLKPDTIYRHLKTLAELGLIEYRKSGKKDCARVTKKGASYYVGNKSESSKNTMSEINPKNNKNSEINPNHYVGNKSEKNSEINPTYKTTNNISLKDYQSTKFKKPSLAEIQSYMRERNNGLDADRFYDYYETNGWVQGRSKIKDWKACVRTWERNNKQAGLEPARPSRKEFHA